MRKSFRKKRRGGRRVGGRVPRGLTSLNTTVRFRLTDNNQPLLYVLSNGSGLIGGYQNADPSGGSGATWTSSEWSTITALYSQVRMISFSVIFTPVAPEDTKVITSSGGNAAYVSGVLSSLATAPTTRSQVFDNADCKIFCPLSMTTGRPYVHTIRPRSVNWAVVTSPNPGSFAGCPGGIQYYGDGYPITTPIFAVSMMGIYEFRSRI